MEKNAKTQFENAKTQFSGYLLAWTGRDRRPKKTPANMYLRFKDVPTGIKIHLPPPKFQNGGRF